MTGRPYFALTLARMRKPCSMPGPRYEPIEERLALSYDALKISFMFKRLAMVFSRDAMFSVVISLSITHGPAISTMGLLFESVSGVARSLISLYFIMVFLWFP